MPEILMSLNLLSQWYARWDERNVRNQNWRSDRNLITAQGRPVGVLVVTHQAAAPIEWDTYFNMIFYPLRPVILFGPTGRSVQAPGMDHKFTVIEWWKDIISLSEASSI